MTQVQNVVFVSPSLSLRHAVITLGDESYFSAAASSPRPRTQKLKTAFKMSDFQEDRQPACIADCARSGGRMTARIK